jgi:hypothetical protein
MGMFIADNTTLDVLAQLNARFGAGEAITEIGALHREFQLFAPAHSLRQTFALLNVAPADQKERQRWYRFLDVLKRYKSDIDSLKGHDRIVKALKDAAEAKKPMAVFFTYHSAKDDPRVTVKENMPLSFSRERYVVISIPTTPAKGGGGAAKGSQRPKK